MAAALSWIRGLRSVGLCADLLTRHHGFTAGRATRDAAKAIAAHAEVAVALLEQALAGPAHVSYVAAYYGLLDLAKIVVVASGALPALKREKFHGMSWTGVNTAAQDLQTDHITLHDRGAGALFYRALTDAPWLTPARTRRKVFMRDVYPYIQCISFEYSQIYGISGLAPLTCEVKATGEKEGHAELTFYGTPAPATLGRSHFKLLAGLKKKSDSTYVSEPIRFNTRDELFERAHEAIRRRFLLYSHKDSAPLGAFAIFQGSAPSMRPNVQFHGFYTPASNSTLLLPEELPILLAFFHLGNVARYDPARLARLRDSRACSIIDVLLSEGVFAFIVSVWSYLTRTEHIFGQ